MTGFEKYLFGEYEESVEDIQKGVTVSASEAYSRINKSLGDEYEAVMEDFEAHHSDREFQGYKRGWKDGIRFLLKVATG